MAYSNLSRAQLSFEYLHTNSTTHEFLFGGLAELVDNARDASAKKIDIFSVPNDDVRGGFLLCFLDDGNGMNPEECSDIITFGRSVKRSLDSNMIGMYGNGLKSGTMRMGKDFILFTKKNTTMSCLFLSRTFHEDEGIEEVIVPLPSFEMTNHKPVTDDLERHRMEMDLIYKYSPFTNEREFFEQFRVIPGRTGTLVVVYNVKLLDDGQPELDVVTNQYDILLANGTGSDNSQDGSLVAERRSFRAYTSILYSDPWMKIYIQKKKVRTKRLASCLYKPRMYKYSSARFKTRAEADARKALEESKLVEDRAKEADIKAKSFEARCGRLNKEQRAELRILQTTAANLKKDTQIKKQMAERKSKSLKEPKTLHFIFGMNIDERNQSGVFIYNCSRLIKMYTKVGPQVEGGMNCFGVMGTVDIPYLVLEPTHNKQDFADAREYRYLQRALGEHMVQYWKDVGIEIQGVTRFWESFGYESSRWHDPPSDDPKYLRKRAMQVPVTLQCDSCLKWRILPFSSSNLDRTFPDKWTCSMNPEPQHNKCACQEAKMNTPEGVLRKEGRSKEQKQQDLEDEIRKKQEQLDKIQKVKSVTSSFQARQLAKEREEQKRIEEIEKKEQEDERKAIEKRVKESEKKRLLAEKQKQEELERKRKERELAAKKKAVVQKTKSAPVPSTQIRKAMVNSQSRAPIRKPLSMTSPATRRRPQPESEEEESESEEEEEDVKPPKRSPVKAPPPPPPTPKRAPAPVTVKSSPKPAPPNKRAAPPATSTSEPPSKRATTDTRTASADSIQPTTIDTTLVKTDEVSSEGETDTGVRVEARVQNEWYSGKIVQVNRKSRKWKIKFSKNPRDKYDIWLDFDSADMKFPDGKDAALASLGVAASDAESPEPPSSSTANNLPDLNKQHMEPIADGYRTCLRYFLPPQWNMEKETISQLSISDLANFPLDDFFDHYEKGLRKLVNNFQTDAQNKQKEADMANGKLSQLRKHIAKLLKTINEDFDIDPETDSEQVDELLAACLRQAVDQQKE